MASERKFNALKYFDEKFTEDELQEIKSLDTWPVLKEILTEVTTDHVKYPTWEKKHCCTEYLAVQPMIRRLGTEKRFMEKPSLTKVPVSRPLVLTGMPRTGSTVLTNLLNVHTGLHATNMADVMFVHQIANPDHDVLRLVGGVLHERPDIHPIDMDEVEDIECLTQTYLWGVAYNWVFNHKKSWWRDADKEFHRAMMKKHRKHAQIIIDHHDMVEKNQRLLLKSHPVNGYFDFEAFLEEFPDAKFVGIYRDVVSMMASACSSEFTIMSNYANLPKKEIAPILLDEFEYTYRRLIDQREGFFKRHPEIARPGPFIDVLYSDLVKDPLNTVKLIVEFTDLGWSDEYRENVRRYLADRPQNYKGKHKYDLAEYGLTPEEIRTRLHFVTEYFGM